VPFWPLSDFGCYGALRENKCLLSLFFIIVFIILTIEIVAGSLILLNASEAAVFVEQSLNIYRYNCMYHNSTLGKYCGSEKSHLDEPSVEQTDWIDNLIKHDWKSGTIPAEFIKFGTPMVRLMWDQTHRLFKCCGINGVDDWTGTNGNITRFFGQVPATCCDPIGRYNVTDENLQYLEFCNENRTDDLFTTGCGDRMGVYSTIMLWVSIAAACVQILALVVSCLLCRNIGDIIDDSRAFI